MIFIMVMATRPHVKCRKPGWETTVVLEFFACIKHCDSLNFSIFLSNANFLSPGNMLASLTTVTCT